MTELIFVTGGSIRKVFVSGRKLTLVTAELGFQPLEIDLDRLDEQGKKMDKMKLNEEEIEGIKELAKLGTEQEIIKDITRDFQSNGWRLIKKNGSS